MYKICSLLLLSILLLSCSKDADRYAEPESYYRNLVDTVMYRDSLRVMTYNIQNGFVNGRNPWDKSTLGATPDYLDKMSSFLRTADPDIIALQEVPVNRSNTVIKRLLDSLGRRLNMNYAFAAHGYNDANGAATPIQGQWGNAILSKYPIEEMESREIAYTDMWTRRITQRVRIRLRDDKIIDVYSLHHHTASANSDLRKTAAFVQESTLPKIVCGDFNSGPDSPMALLRLVPAWDHRQMGIDQIYHSPEFLPRGLEQYPGTQLSDHPPISVRLGY